MTSLSTSVPTVTPINIGQRGGEKGGKKGRREERSKKKEEINRIGINAMGRQGRREMKTNLHRTRLSVQEKYRAAKAITG